MNIESLGRQNEKLFFYKKDALIYAAYTKPKFVFFIKSGQVKMVTKNTEGNEFIQSVFSSGECFGEPALLTNKPYLADTIALEDTYLYKVSESAFLSAIKSDTDFALSFIRNLCDRLFYKSMMLEEVANEDASHSLLTLINYLTSNLTKEEPLKITRKQLAAMAGLREETVIRIIKELALKSKIKLIKSKIYKLNDMI